MTRETQCSHGIGHNNGIHTCDGCCIQDLRTQLEKIAWKHYNPDASINVENMLDEMMPVIEQHYGK